jgi:acyl-CoA dehydrogenase family protein 9
VLRAFIALTGMKPPGDELSGLGDVSLADPIGSLGWARRLRRGPDRSSGAPGADHLAHRELAPLADSVSEQVGRLRAVTESLLRAHRGAIVERQFHQKRLASAVADIYAQVAVHSRVTDHLAEHGVEPSGQELYICETFCRRATDRVVGVLDQVERNDDERMVAIAKLAYSAATTATRLERRRER